MSQDLEQSVARNAGVLMISQLTTWGLTLLLTVFLPRYLGAVAMGQLHLANSIWAILAIIIAFGMDMLLAKEVARAPERAGALLSTSVVLRVLLYGFGLGLLAFYLSLVNYAQDTVTIILIIGLGNLFWQFSGAVVAVLQGLERMEYISLGSIAGKLFNTVISLILLWLGYDVLAIAAVSVGAAFFTFLIQGLFLRRLIPIQIKFRPAAAGKMLKEGVAYLATGIFLVAYMQMDVIIISLLVTERVVGWYGAADRLFGTLLFIPTVFTTAIYPALSRLYEDSTEETLPRLMRRSFNLLLLLSLPIGLGIMVIAQPLVVLLFGQDFIGSGPVLAVMGIVLILTYQNILLGFFFISMDRQKTWAVVMAVATLATIPLDLVLIPWCQQLFGNGAIGGALAFIFTEVGMMIVGLKMLPRGTLTPETAGRSLRALLAGAGMTVVAWLLRDRFLLIPIAAAALTYPALIWLLGLTPEREIEMLLSLLQRLWAKIRGRNRPEVAKSESS